MVQPDVRFLLTSRPNTLEAFVDDYLALMLAAPPEGDVYTEKHHILPASLFPQYRRAKWNVVRLCGAHHLLAHYYLAAACPTDAKVAAAYLSMFYMDPSSGRKNRIQAVDVLTHRVKLPVPTADLIAAFAKAREVRADYLHGFTTVRVKGTDTCIQIPKKSFDPEVHERTTAGMVNLRNTVTGEVRHVPVDHLLCASADWVHLNAGMVAARDATTGQNVHITTEDYHASPDRYTTCGTGRTDLKPNLGRTSIIDENGTFRWVSQDDPELSVNLFTGRWKPPFKGKLTVIEVATGKRFSVPCDDSRIASGELVPQSKGMATVVDRSGRVFQVAKGDPRIASGELTPNNTGRLRAIVVTTGERCRVYPGDPRLLTGEVKLEELKKDTMKKVSAYDKDGNRKRVYPNDPRLLSGEFQLKGE